MAVDLLLHLRALGLVTLIVTVQNPGHHGRRLSGPWVVNSTVSALAGPQILASAALLSIATGGKAVLSMLGAHFFSCRWVVARLRPHT